MSDKIDMQALGKLLGNMGGGKSGDQVARDLQGGKIDNLLKLVSPSDAAKIKEVLADKNKTQQILQSDEAQSLMRQLFGDGKNG
jgi:hypothetical protein